MSSKDYWMTTFFAIMMVALAGASNGLYLIALVKFKRWPQEAIWAFFSLVSFVIIPIFTILIPYHHKLGLLFKIGNDSLLILICGGALFGIGMIMFTWSLRYIGIGVAFVLNISFGTVFGAIIPIIALNPTRLLSRFGFFEVLSLLLFIAAAAFVGLAISLREQGQNELKKSENNRKLVLGILCGTLSGLFCSFQGAAYGYGADCLKRMDVYTGHLLFDALNILWLPIFFAAFVPYFLYHLFLLNKEVEKVNILIGINWLYLLTMGLLYFLPLIIYAKAVQLLGDLGTTVAWPILMAFIVLTSNALGWYRGEWEHAGREAIKCMKAAILFLLLAIVGLGVAGQYNLHTYKIITNNNHNIESGSKL